MTTIVPAFATLQERMVFDGFASNANPFIFYGDWASNFLREPFVWSYEGTLCMPWAEDPPTVGETEVDTAEHPFQASKATNREDFLYVLRAPTAFEAKQRGGAIPLRADWELVKFHVMVCVLRSKFAHDPMRGKLLRTGRRPIYEDSPHDDIWGVRRRHKPAGTPDTYDGRNLLGQALMKVREEMR